MPSAHYHAIKSVPLEMKELRLVEQLTLPGSPEHRALEKIVGPVSAHLSEKEALSQLLRLGADLVQQHMEPQQH